ASGAEQSTGFAPYLGATGQPLQECASSSLTSPKRWTGCYARPTRAEGDARPLVFRPIRSARSDPSSVSVAISLVPPIYCSLSSGLCQREFLSAARIDNLARRPRRMAASRARRERNSRAFIVDKETPNLCAASLVESP